MDDEEEEEEVSESAKKKKMKEEEMDDDEFIDGAGVTKDVKADKEVAESKKMKKEEEMDDDEFIDGAGVTKDVKADKEVAESKKMKKDEEEDKEIEESAKKKMKEEEDEEEEMEESVMATAALATVGVVATLAAIKAMKKGGEAALRKMGEIGYKAAEAKERKELQKAKKRYEDEINSVAAKFEGDTKLEKMYADLPKYMPGYSEKAKKQNAERKKQMNKIAKYIKSKLDDREMNAFADISAAVRSQHTKIVQESYEENVFEKLQDRLSEMTDEELVEVSTLINDPIVASAKAVTNAVEENIEVPASIDELISEDSTLSEDFKTKASVIFEATVSEKVEEFKTSYQEKIQEEIQSKFESISDKIDQYLSYVVESWMQENNEALESNVRTEISESFIESLKNVFEAHYIEMPEGKKDVYAEMVEKASELEERFEEQSAEMAVISEQLEELKKEKILKEFTEDLYDTQAERFFKLSENLEFVDEENFKNKIRIIKESFFKSDDGKSEEDTNETLSESSTSEIRTTVVEEEEDTKLNSVMGKYVEAISKHSK
jgi:hypothetical protein